ncbi:MAG: sialidase family protein [Acidobacteria bacterium]|nr:sialidase family protein [Acidobacteriota bacterium]
MKAIGSSLLREARSNSLNHVFPALTIAQLAVSKGAEEEKTLKGKEKLLRIPGKFCGAISLLFLLVTVAWGQDGSVEPLEQVSGTSPFLSCTADAGQFGRNFLNSEVEPWIAVNPIDPLNIVGTWQQDRWSNGGARGLSVGVSFDGGRSWERVVIPGLTRCSGGQFLRASDPWISFGPDGSLYHIALVFNPGNAMLVSRSADGGRTWFGPSTLILDGFPFFNDKESITADPTDPNLVYAVWDRLNFNRNRGPAVFTRSLNGGSTWTPARVIHDPGFNAQTLANQILVQPDGTVINFFAEIFNFPIGPFFLAFKKSNDKGENWLPVFGASRAVRIRPMGAIDPDNQIPVRSGTFIFDIAVDPGNGTLYAVWQEGSLSQFQRPEIAFLMSANGGQTWSPPVAINRTPSGINSLARQAFTPSIAVTDNGTIGVTYYDFRFDGPEPEALTDHWFIWCHPQATDCANPARWRNEIRLTDASFDLGKAPAAGGLFLGDYTGLTAVGKDFIALFTQPHGTDPASAFARRIVLEEAVRPRDAGFWKHQVQSIRSGRGRAQETRTSLRQYLADIRVLYDIFDSVGGLPRLESTLSPILPPTFRARAERHLLALLLNLTSSRLSPFVQVRDGESVVESIASIVEILESPASTIAELEMAKDLAEAINQGDFPLE